MAEGGWSSGTWGEAGWGCSVYDRVSSAGAAPLDSMSAAASLNSLVSEFGFGFDSDSTAQSVYNAQVNDEAVAVESTEIAAVVFGTTIVESINILDVPIGGLTFDCVAANAVNATDIFLAQATFNGNSIVESVAANDAPFANTILPVVINEFVDCSIEVDSAVGLYCLIFETSSVSELYAAQVTFGSVTNDGSTAQDVVSTQATFNSLSQENARASNTFTGAGAFISNVNETAKASDTFVRRFLWELIDDNQAVSWQLINTNE
jgi:hypothetical protein